MTEGGIADRELAALALKQASGDNVEAIFLLRAYRTTLTKTGGKRAARHHGDASSNGVFQRFIKIFPAASCLAQPTTTPIACSISLCWQTAKRRR
ncbi:carbon-phosphorus lyase complex subunit PhnI [Escherichia coli]|uniref:carbon-phosphorus lyase complex subunit PhnI n=1 Tax=Escherichia coli TaxID=562 RepID=UPI003B285316